MTVLKVAGQILAQTCVRVAFWGCIWVGVVWLLRVISLGTFHNWILAH